MKKPHSQITSMRQSRISWAEDKIIYLPKETMQSETVFCTSGNTLHRNLMVQNVLLSVNTLDLTTISCTDLSLHYIFCLVAKADHGSWSILLIPIMADFSTSLPGSFAMNSSRRYWDKMPLEHQCSNPASRTALASAPIKYRSLPLLHDTHSSPC